MSNTAQHDRRLVGWLSLAQLITWGSVFYTFALLLEPVERELGLTRAQSSLAFSLALADRVYVLQKGEVRFSGPSSALRDDPSLREELLALAPSVDRVSS